MSFRRFALLQIQDGSLSRGSRSLKRVSWQPNYGVDGEVLDQPLPHVAQVAVGEDTLRQDDGHFAAWPCQLNEALQEENLDHTALILALLDAPADTPDQLR